MAGYEEYVRLSNEEGTLILNTPSDGVGGVFNFSVVANVSLVCITDFVRGKRAFDETRGCASTLWNLLQLKGFEVRLFPLEVRMPWETWLGIDADDDEDSLGDVGSGSSAALALAPPNQPHFARHTGDTHHHDDYYYTFFPVDVFWFFFVILFFALFAGVCVSDSGAIERVVVPPPPAKTAFRPANAPPSTTGRGLRVRPAEDGATTAQQQQQQQQQPLLAKPTVRRL